MFTGEINPFDLLSGKVVQNSKGIFYFKEPGNNIHPDGYPVYKNLHRLDGPACIYYIPHGLWIFEDKPLYFINGVICCNLDQFNEVVNEYKQRNKPV